MQQINTAAVMNTTPPKPNSEVLALTLEKDRIAKTFARWDTAYIWLAGATVAVAGFLFIVQFVAHRKGRELQNAQEAELKAKDRQLAADLKAKDDEISRLNNDTGVLAKQNTQLKGDLDTEAANARSTAASLEKKNLDTQRELEKERRKRAEMEASLSLRTLNQYSDKGRKDLEPLKLFHGTKVVIQCISDAEAFRAAAQLREMLVAAHWDVSGPNVNPAVWSDFWDGAVLNLASSDIGVKPVDEKVWFAAIQLREYLKTSGWAARRALTSPSDPIPSDTVRVTVGFRPMLYFFPQDVKEALQRGQSARKVMEDGEHQGLENTKTSFVTTPQVHHGKSTLSRRSIYENRSSGLLTLSTGECFNCGVRGLMGVGCVQSCAS